ncbi:MAG: RidA family protein [Thermoleophilia bacterium]
MSHSVVNPAGLHDPAPWGYAHTARVPAGCELVYVAGQYASSEDGSVVSPVFAEQVARTLDNLALALAAHDLSLADVVRLRTYVVDLDLERLRALTQAVMDRWGRRPPVNTVIGVAALATPDMSFEVEAVAARP